MDKIEWLNENYEEPRKQKALEGIIYAPPQWPGYKGSVTQNVNKQGQKLVLSDALAVQSQGF